MAQGAAHDDRAPTSPRACSARPGRSTFNKPIAETMYAEHQDGRPAAVERGRPDAGARRVQTELKVQQSAACDRRRSATLRGPVRRRRHSAAAAPTTSATSRGTCRRSTLRYPSNIPSLPGHNWANAIAMATPIAHKGVDGRRQGAGDDDARPPDRKPELVTAGVGLLQNVQTKDRKYIPLIRADDKPAIWLNKAIDGQVPAGDEEVLLRSRRSTRRIWSSSGIKYPTVRARTGVCPERFPPATPRPYVEPSAVTRAIAASRCSRVNGFWTMHIGFQKPAPERGVVGVA